MSVYRSRNTYRADVYVNGRKVASKSGFAKKSLAKKWHNEKETELRGRDPKQECPSRSLNELLAHFETRHLPNVRHGTKERYKTDFRLRIEPFFRYMQLEDIDATMLEAFKSHLISRDLKPKTINLCLNNLRLLLNKAVKWGFIEKSPYNLDPLPLPKSPYEWWSDKSHIKAFLAEARKRRYYAAYLLAIETGMRYGEIMGLSKQDIDFGKGVIHVHRQWLQEARAYGPTKHDEPRWLDFDTDSELAKVLWKACQDSPDDEAIFVTSTGARPFKGGVAHKYFHKIQEKAKVPKICFHALRHTYASWYMQEVGDIWALKANLGHADIRTTMRYAHHAKGQRKQVLNMSGIVAHKSLTSSHLRAVSG